MDLLTYKKAVADAPKPTTAQVKTAVDDYLSENPLGIDATLTDPTKAAPAKAVGDELSQIKGDKLDKPETPPDAAGKVLRVLAVNEDGTFTCEWADAPTGGAVDDVRINGTSVVEDGVANIPITIGSAIGNKTSPGVANVKPHGAGGISASSNDGSLITAKALQEHISNRTESNYIDGATYSNNHSRPIVPCNLDYAVKAAMCDGKGAAWTDAERLASLLRIGCTVDDNGFVKWAAQEVSE